MYAPPTSKLKAMNRFRGADGPPWRRRRYIILYYIILYYSIIYYIIYYSILYYIIVYS